MLMKNQFFFFFLFLFKITLQKKGGQTSCREPLSSP